MITGISFGTGGHLHNISAYYGNKPHVFKFTPPPPLKDFSVLGHSSHVIGNPVPDSQEFNDFAKLKKSNTTTRLRKLTVYYKKNK